MIVVREKPAWTSIGAFSLILILTAVAIELFGTALDPWQLTHQKDIELYKADYPRLSGFNLECAAGTGLVTGIDVVSKSAACVPVLKSELTECSGGLPMRGFADKIACSKPEKKNCEEAGLQALGLFEGDAYCAKFQALDLGPPPLTVRPEDPSG